MWSCDAMHSASAASCSLPRGAHAYAQPWGTHSAYLSAARRVGRTRRAVSALSATILERRVVIVALAASLDRPSARARARALWLSHPGSCAVSVWSSLVNDRGFVRSLWLPSLSVVHQSAFSTDFRTFRFRPHCTLLPDPDELSEHG